MADQTPYTSDDIDRGLAAIRPDYYEPPVEMDLRGLDAATRALGLTYGFDRWQDARVMANNRRLVETAREHWNEVGHPTDDFLRHTLGEDESAVRHRHLLERAHPDCARCADKVALLQGDAT